LFLFLFILFKILKSLNLNFVQILKMFKSGNRLNSKNVQIGKSFIFKKSFKHKNSSK
jgi:hypothetical protein